MSLMNGIFILIMEKILDKGLEYVLGMHSKSGHEL